MYLTVKKYIVHSDKYVIRRELEDTLYFNPMHMSRKTVLIKPYRIYGVYCSVSCFGEPQKLNGSILSILYSELAPVGSGVVVCEENRHRYIKHFLHYFVLLSLMVYTRNTFIGNSVKTVIPLLF